MALQTRIAKQILVKETIPSILGYFEVQGCAEKIILWNNVKDCVLAWSLFISQEIANLRKQS